MLLCLLLPACARVGAPLPPLKRQPPAIAGVTAAQEAGDLVLTGSLPSANVDKSPIAGYLRLEVVGAQRPIGTGSQEFDGILLPVGSWEGPALAPYVNSAKRTFAVRIPLRDRFGEVGGLVAVRLRYQNEREHWSPWSDLVLQPVARVAQAPEGLAARVDADGIHLSWTPAPANFDGSRPPLADGVLVFRRELPDGAMEPAGQADAPATSATLGEFQWDAHYAFAVAAFRRVGNARVRSALSPWIEVDTKDVYPPPAPVALSLLLEDGKIRLIWDPVAEPDLAGYLVFRRDAPGEAPRPLTAEPVADPFFVDGTADPASVHWYAVVAVDRHGNRSPLSEEAAYEPARATE
jgi:hypothetical protein